MARPRKPEKLALSVPVRTWLRRADAITLSRRARAHGKPVSVFLRDTVLAAIATGGAQ